MNVVRAVLDEDFQWIGQCPAWHDTRLDGLNYVMLLQWPGKIAQGNGTQQILIDARANAWQREALRKILHGEATAQGATHFFVFNSTMTNVLEPQFVPIDLSIHVEARQAMVKVPGLVESKGTPISNPHTGRDHRAGIHLPRKDVNIPWPKWAMGRPRLKPGLR